MGRLQRCATWASPLRRSAPLRSDDLGVDGNPSQRNHVFRGKRKEQALSKKFNVVIGKGKGDALPETFSMVGGEGRTPEFGIMGAGRSPLPLQELLPLYVLSWNG